MHAASTHKDISKGQRLRTTHHASRITFDVSRLTLPAYFTVYVTGKIALVLHS